jgi:hypothetical protein
LQAESDRQGKLARVGVKTLGVRIDVTVLKHLRDVHGAVLKRKVNRPPFLYPYSVLFASSELAPPTLDLETSLKARETAADE